MVSAGLHSLLRVADVDNYCFNCLPLLGDAKLQTQFDRGVVTPAKSKELITILYTPFCLIDFCTFGYRKSIRLSWVQLFHLSAMIRPETPSLCFLPSPQKDLHHPRFLCTFQHRAT